MCITLFCTFQCPPCTTMTWNGLFNVLRRTKTSDHDFFFLSLNLSAVPRKSTLGKFAYIRHFQGIGVNAIVFEKTWIHYNSDVFAALFVDDGKAPWLAQSVTGQQLIRICPICLTVSHDDLIDKWRFWSWRFNIYFIWFSFRSDRVFVCTKDVPKTSFVYRPWQMFL